WKQKLYRETVTRHTWVGRNAVESFATYVFSEAGRCRAPLVDESYRQAQRQPLVFAALDQCQRPQFVTIVELCHSGPLNSPSQIRVDRKSARADCPNSGYSTAAGTFSHFCSQAIKGCTVRSFTIEHY